MAVHMIKLCVGIDSVEHLIQVRKMNRAKHAKDYNFHITRFRPKRAQEILEGGSIYWVIKGFVTVRQRIIGFEDVDTDHGKKCMIKMDTELHLTQSQPRRPFQGWRYFEESVAPKDFPKGQNITDIPPEMKNDLRNLGLI